MKIAIIVNPLIPVPPEKYGGIERIVFMIIQELTKLGHEITLFASEYSHPNCKLIGYSESSNYNFADFIKINVLTLKIRLKGFDLVHTFGRMSNIASLMLTDLPKIVSYQLPPTTSQVKKAVKIAPTGSLYFTTCSNFISRQIIDLCDVTTVYNGVTIKDYDFKGLIKNDAPLIFLGRIQKEKGTAIAISVAKKTGKSLIIAGNIPNEKIHQDYFTDFVLPWIDNQQIKYIGPVNDRKKNDLLQDSLAFLMPVTWDEPFGIVMTEALACGTPIIGFNRGAVPEVVDHGVNGFICENEEDMINAVGRVDLIKRENCRKTVVNKFTSDIIAMQYEQLYKKALKKF